MRRLSKRALAVGVFLVLWISVPALAEDIEIYVGGNLTQEAVTPNILFIVDTSGSMDSDVTTQETYNPAFDYST